MSVSSVSNAGFSHRVLSLASDLVPEPVKKVAYAVTLPVYMTVAFGGIGAVLGGTVGGLTGPVGLIAGGLSGGSMGASVGAVLGAQLALASLHD